MLGERPHSRISEAHDRQRYEPENLQNSLKAMEVQAPPMRAQSAHQTPAYQDPAVAGLTRELGCPPPALVLEGGYDLDAFGEGVEATILGLREDAPKWEHLAGASPRPVREAREALVPFWEV